jgi:hypothetical protein
VGDQILVAVAGRLNGSLRISDTAARFGGDEFVIVVEDLEEAHEAIDAAKRIEESLRTPFRIQDLEISIIASVGLAFSDGSGRCQAEDLMRTADAAMYEAKGRSKGHHLRFDDVRPGCSTERSSEPGQPGLSGIDFGELLREAPDCPILRGASSGLARLSRADGPVTQGKGEGLR